jgi:DNA-binding Xre family transcriptional regulator
MLGGFDMAISYSKLWQLLADKNMSKPDLRRAANIAPNTMTKLYRNQEVSMSVLIRICAVLSVNIGDVIDLYPINDTDRTVIAE